jgi:ParB family transcriptional regulator, chromosome partitioning protein
LRDLFTPEHDGYLTDPALLDRLAAVRLEREAEAIRAEGWKWLDIMPEVDYPALRQFRRVSRGAAAGRSHLSRNRPG